MIILPGEEECRLNGGKDVLRSLQLELVKEAYTGYIQTFTKQGGNEGIIVFDEGRRLFALYEGHVDCRGYEALPHILSDSENPSCDITVNQMIEPIWFGLHNPGSELPIASHFPWQ